MLFRSSHADDVLVSRIWSEAAGGVSFTLGLAGLTPEFEVSASGMAALEFRGKGLRVVDTDLEFFAQSGGVAGKCELCGAPGAGALKPKIYEAARRTPVPIDADSGQRDEVRSGGEQKPVRGPEAEREMIRRGPEAGDWRFRFITGGKGGIVLFWVTLADFRNRQRDILIDPATNEAALVGSGDLDAQDREQLLNWAAKMLADLLSGKTAKPALPAAGGAGPGGEDDEDEPYEDLFADDGGDDDSGGLGALAASLLSSFGGSASGGPSSGGGSGGTASGGGGTGSGGGPGGGSP